MISTFLPDRRERLPVRLIIATFAAATLLQLAMQFVFAVSDLVILDDTIYFSSYFFGDPVSVPTNFIPYKLLEITTAFRSVLFIKILSVATLGMIAAIFAALLDRLTSDKLLAFLAALAFTTYTVALDQGFFVTGSHPSLGALFALGSLALFIKSGSQTGYAGLALIFSSALFALLSSASSPTTLLIVLAPPLWALIAFAFHRSPRIFGISFALTIWPAILRGITGNNSFHYAKAEGWTELSLQNFLQNTGNALAVVFVAPLSGNWLQAGLYIGFFVLLTVAMAAVFIRLKPWRDVQASADSSQELLLLLACALAGAILVLGPSLVVTAYQPRYAWPAYLFGALLPAASLVWLSAHSYLPRRQVLAVLTGFIALNIATTIHRRDTEFLPYLTAHRLVAAATRDAASLWPVDAQIVVLLPKDLSSPSQGQNHWSAGYLRLLSRSPDILALVGPDHRLSDKPFVEEWSPNGEDYWSEKDGRMSRERMKGLERDRPTFAYRYNAATEAIESVMLAFLDPSGARFTLAPGQSMDRTQHFTPADCGDDGMAIFNWPVSQNLDDSDHAWSDRDMPWSTIEHIAFSAIGTNEQTVPVKLAPATPVRLTITLSADNIVDRDEPTSATFPPMPVISAAIKIYQKANGFHVTSDGIASIVSGDLTDAITIVGVEGCFYHAQIGGTAYPLEIRSLNGKWTIGRGFKERFWRGDIDWNLETAAQ